MVCALHLLDAGIWEDVVIWADAVRPYRANAEIWVDGVIRVDADIWADAVRPYKPNNAMEMVGHQDEFVLVNGNFFTNAD